ncbi:probable cytochrome P450 9f2 [Anopheles nili]|uniref:probable cytochrome P450 9f2 n=1 Tax=Anopheles nili TaxID=185578 RepID=UPI00237A39B6|nr:probable cytochrome P450 9f2 [Anopheles nili]
MVAGMLFVIAIALLLVMIYRYLAKINTFFDNIPIPCLPTVPLFGSSRRLILKRISFNDFIRTNYERFPDAKVFGMFELLTPMFVVRDPELVKHIMVKDFDHFINHRLTMHEDSGADSNMIFTRSLFMLRGQRWRNIRTALTPTFTGSKMRQMFMLIVECSESMVQALARQIPREYEVKELFIRFTNDVIASCAFGVNVNSFDDPENVFFRYGKELTDFGRLHVFLKMMGFQVCPRLMAWLELDIFDRKHVRFFTDVFRQSVEARERLGVVRPDMVHLLTQARKGTLRYQPQDERVEVESYATAKDGELTEQPLGTGTLTLGEKEMVAQSMIFFLAGYDTVAAMISFLAYELAVAPDIQQRLYEEIRHTADVLEGRSLTYDALQAMRYLDMVVSETLRKWPPNPTTDRHCNRDYTIAGHGDFPDVTIPVGATVAIPIAGLHYDPRYYPDPERFDPERFSEENRQNIPTGAYIPFGIGPRNCIASRFALMEVKAIVYHLLRHFEFQPTERTSVPMQLKKGFTTLKAENGIHLKLVSRDSN